MANSVPGKVLFISHEASRSGAPIVLLHLLKWIKKNTNLQFEILLLTGGKLKPDFELVAKTFLLSDLTGQHTYRHRVKKKLLKITADDQHKKAADYLSKRGYDLVYGNTIVSVPWLKLFKENHSIKTICCVHELSYVINYFYSNEYLQENLNLVDCVIAVSNAVKENFMNSYNLPDGKVKLHYEFIDTDNGRIFNNLKKDDLGVDAEEFVIGMGGNPEWRKGADLLIPLALKLKELHPDFKFRIVWLGAGIENEFVKQLLYDARKCKIDDRLVFIESHPNPLDFINIFDVFVLLSREDPFPLIALEAAFLKKPVIAFENSGGMPELIRQGAGFLAPYLDTVQVANEVYKLSKNAALKNQIGDKASELVISTFSSAVVSPNIYGLIKNLIGPPHPINEAVERGNKL